MKWWIKTRVSFMQWIYKSVKNLITLCLSSIKYDVNSDMIIDCLLLLSAKLYIFIYSSGKINIKYQPLQYVLK